MLLAIFDCDGTLVDSQHRIGEAMARAFRHNGLTPPDPKDTRRVVGLSLVEAVAQLAPELPREQVVTVAASYKNAFFDMRQSRELESPLYPGAAQTIAALAGRDDIVLGIATGKSRRGVDALIEQFGFHGVFMTIQTADDHPSKPHPSMIHQALSETGFDAAQAVMIGDTHFDMTMARAAGVDALGVDWGYHGREELLEAGASRVVAHFDELQSVLEALPLKGAAQ